MTKIQWISNRYEGKCPHCESKNIERQDSIIDDTSLTHKYICQDCKTNFKEVYTIRYAGSLYIEEV